MESSITKEEFDEIFKLMQKSFPESEYRPYEQQFKLLKVKEYKILTQYDGSGNLKAFAAIWDFPKFLFVEHLAVNPIYRGGGIGTKIMKDLIKSCNKRVILEIEPPQNEISIKRLQFYERLGFHICNYEYYQKPLREGQGQLRLNLMSYPDFLDKNSFDYINDYLRKYAYKPIS